MNEKRYDIIYFHGLDSSLNEEKREALKVYGNVKAPTYDYRNSAVLKDIEKTFTYSNNTNKDQRSYSPRRNIALCNLEFI